MPPTPKRRIHAQLPASGVIVTITALTVTGAPYWLTGLVALLMTALGLVQTVFPQESKDRLKWWLDVGRPTVRREHVPPRRHTSHDPVLQGLSPPVPPARENTNRPPMAPSRRHET